MSIERMLEALAAPPLPANEVVSLDRRTVERALTLLESHQDLAQAGPSLCAEVCVIRQALAAPKVELWAIHSPGPREWYPCLDKEDAERRAQELRDLGEKMKADMIARGESVEFWSDWIVNVIPSPWESAEHFEIMAEEWQDYYRDLAEAHKTLQTDHDRVSNNRDMWKGQVERQADELTKLRAELEAMTMCASAHDKARSEGITRIEDLQAELETWRGEARARGAERNATMVERDALQAHVDEMTKMREAHGFDSWAAVLVEMGRLRARGEAC